MIRPHFDRIKRPASLLHGSGGADTPADREVRYRPYDCERENRNDADD